MIGKPAPLPFAGWSSPLPDRAIREPMGAFLGRLALVAALVGFAGVGLVWVEGGGAGSRGHSVRYQFVDAAGRVQIVDSLEAVPPDKREGVGRIELDEPADREQAQTGGRTAFSVRSWFGGSGRVGGEKLIVYTTQRCGLSKRLLSELDARGVEYENRDIDLDREAKAELMDLTGSEGVPVSVYGEQVWQGYNPRRARELESAVESSWF